MDRLYVVKMPDGREYGVPAEIIARNKAEYYYGSPSDPEHEAEYQAMLYWFDTGDYEFADWAKNNMNWDDVKEHAKLMPGSESEVDYQEGWINGEYRYFTGK